MIFLKIKRGHILNCYEVKEKQYVSKLKVWIF